MFTRQEGTDTLPFPDCGTVRKESLLSKPSPSLPLAIAVQPAKACSVPSMRATPLLLSWLGWTELLTIVTDVLKAQGPILSQTQHRLNL